MFSDIQGRGLGSMGATELLGSQNRSFKSQSAKRKLQVGEMD